MTTRAACLTAFVVACFTPSTIFGEGALSEVERLKVELRNTKEQLARAIIKIDECQVELAPTRTRLNALVVQAESDKLAEELEAAHPGYRVDRKTWLLVPVSPVAAAVPPKP